MDVLLKHWFSITFESQYKIQQAKKMLFAQILNNGNEHAELDVGEDKISAARRI